MEYLPIVVPTLCRSDHFIRLIESLKKCTGASQTELFIGIDYPTKATHWDGYKIICEYCKSIVGFKDVHVFIREKNMGEQKNVGSLIEEVRSNGYLGYIFSEDDNEFAPNALLYLNQGMTKYRNDDRVFCICAYPHPDKCLELMKGYDKNCYCMKGYIAWGYAMWLDRRDNIKEFISKGDSLLSIKTALKLMKGGKYQTLHRLFYRKVNATSDLRKNAYCTLENKYCIFPVVPKCRNWGFDGSGSNCGGITNMYEKRVLDSSKDFNMDDIEIAPNKLVDKVHNKYYAGTIWTRCLVLLEYFFFKITGKCFHDFRIIRRLMGLRVKATNI